MKSFCGKDPGASYILLEISDGYFVSAAGVVGQDYINRVITVSIPSGGTRGCTDQYGSVDDNLAPILEDIEFYQISLTSGDSADIIPERAIANIFIEDNDGMCISCLCDATIYVHVHPH